MRVWSQPMHDLVNQPGVVVMAIRMVLAGSMSMTVLAPVMIMAVAVLQPGPLARRASWVHASQHARKATLQHVDNYAISAPARTMQKSVRVAAAAAR